MKRSLKSRLIALLSLPVFLAATLSSEAPKPEKQRLEYKIPAQTIEIGKYIPEGEEPTLLNCSVMDYNGDGKPDLRETDIETEGENSDSTIAIIHKYENKTGKLIEYPIVVMTDRYKLKQETDELLPHIREEYDFFTEGSKDKKDYNFTGFSTLEKDERTQELIRLNNEGKLNPDGIVDHIIDLPDSLKLKPRIEIEIIPQEKEQTPRKPIPKPLNDKKEIYYIT